MHPSYRGTYKPDEEKYYQISRSKIEDFVKCPKCFYLDRRLGVGRPSMPGYTLNSAVDELLKKEFDLLRKEGHTHELMKQYGIDAIPYQDDRMDTWRANFTGISVDHEPTKFHVFGAVDDVWVNPAGEFYIVDYKSTSTEKEISLEDQYKQGYKRQMEFYQWLFRQNGFKVSNRGFFVFANADKNLSSFDGKLNFKMTILEHVGSDSWVEEIIIKAHDCLNNNSIPESNPDCEFCQYRQASHNFD